MQPLSRRTTAVFSILTVVGVLSGTGLNGESLSGSSALPLGVWLAGLLWLQRRHPVTGLLLGACTVLAFRITGLTDVGWLWPVTFLYVAAVLSPRPRIRTVIAVAVLHALSAFNVDWTVLTHTASRATANVGTEALWLSAVIAAALSYRNWLRWQKEIVQRLRTELDEQRTAERLRVAQEVHDAVAHTLAVVGVHVNVAADALDTAPDEARDALRLAQDVRRKAMADLSSLVGVLRDDRLPPAEPLPLDDLVARVRATGLRTTLEVTGDEEETPLAVRLVASRIVREALTNAVRHAGATTVRVAVSYGGSGAAGRPTEVTVRDDGAGSSAPPGHGLTGLAERVAALAGTFRSGNADGGGFEVHAKIPA
ncbi:sensor histidine kinase [Dactylosporangium fulvum]|uniref:histidine kinase n=1 Tax=Dactylosporangium fulvum TaxID=53359 RepID=A0ABY5VY00_9ACTN|nr:histidine kinase [Dactylosporangium fulvum]UWP81358.1 histidine kinase [Dactylosporangium fulvum]